MKVSQTIKSFILRFLNIQILSIKVEKRVPFGYTM